MSFNTSATYKRLLAYSRLKGNYTPSPYGDVDDAAETLHSFYHYDTDVADTTDPGYRLSLIGFFLATFFIGVIFLCCICCVNCMVTFRSCRLSLRKCFDFFNGKRGRKAVVGLFCSTAVFFTASLFGYFDIIAAIDGLAESLGKLAADFKLMEKNAYDLYQQRGSKGSYEDARVKGYRNYIFSANCSVLDNAGMEAYYEGTETLYESLEGLGEDIEGMSASIWELSGFITLGQFALVVLYWVLAGLGVFATTSKNCSCDDSLLLLLSTATLVGFMCYLGFMVTLSVGLGDFCTGPDGTGPDASMYALVDNTMTGSQHTLLMHYIGCEGDNPIIEAIGNMTTVLASLNLAADTGLAKRQCDASMIDAISGETTGTLGYLDNIVEPLKCSSINPLIQKTIYVHVCDNLINGVWATWASQCVATVFLWLGLMIFPFAVSQKADVLAAFGIGKILWEDLEDEVEKAEREASEAAEKKRLDDERREREVAEAKRIQEAYEAQKASAFDDIEVEDDFSFAI